MNLRVIVSACLIAALMVGCTTDFEVYAPEKEIRSVYCVLNPTDSVQYVRVAKAFQFKGDVLQYAGANDFIMSGRTVRLSDGTRTWTAEEMPASPRDSGIFIPYHTIYRFITDGSGPGRDTLRDGATYKLEVGAPEDPDYVSGETTTPNVPKLKGLLGISSGPGNSKCLNRLALDRDFTIYWSKAGDDLNYEVRVGLEYERNGVAQPTATWGPTELFSTNRRCNEGAGNICYKWEEKDLLRAFLADMPEDPQVTYTYNTTDSCVPQASMINLLPKSLWFEVTVVDVPLGNYMTVNNPKFSDLTGTKPEYTNLSGKVEAVGIFGSINIDRKYGILSYCSEALLSLNGTPTPAACSW